MIKVTSTDFGGAWVNICSTDLISDFVFLPIPKNASNWVYSFFKQNDWKHYRYDDGEIADKKKLIVLRDPTERWCSGLTQEVYVNKIDLNLNDSTVVDEIFTKFNYGLHSHTQVSFLQGLDLSDCYFLKFGPNLKNDLFKFARTEMKLRPFTHIPDKGGSDSDDIFKNKIVELLNSNPKYQTALREYLHEDQELFDNVTFYNG